MGVLEDRKLLGISRTLSVLYIDGSKGVPAMSSKQSTDLKVREETEKYKQQSSAAEDAADRGAKRMRAGAFSKTAERALTIYKEKRAQIKKLSGREFTPQPEESGADEGMAEQVAGMIATYEHLKKRTQEASDGAGMREEAARDRGGLLGTFADFPQSEERMKLYFTLACFEIRPYEEAGLKVFRAVRAYEAKKANKLLGKLTEL